MRVVVFGATRGVGLAVSKELLAQGHAVRAFARDPSALAGLEVEVARGDVLRPETVRAAVAGMEGVVSALGQGTSNAPTTHMSEGTAAILSAMKEHGVARGIFVTSLGACDDPDEPFLFRFFGRWMFGNIFADHRRLEAKVRASAAAYTLVRPGALTDAPGRGTYRVRRDVRAPGAGTIARADVAHFIARELVANEHVGEAVALGY